MKFSKFAPLLAISAMLFAVVMTACSTTSTSTSATGVVTITTKAPLTPAQIVAKLCPPAKVALNNFSQLQGLTKDASSGLVTATSYVNQVCAAGATFDMTNVQTIIDTGVPILLNVVKVSALTQQQQNDLTLSVGAIQTAYAFIQSVNAP